MKKKRFLFLKKIDKPLARILEKAQKFATIRNKRDDITTDTVYIKRITT